MTTNKPAPRKRVAATTPPADDVRQTQIDRLVARAVQIKDALEANKPLYDELDEITVQLAALQFSQAPVGAKVVTLVDNFAAKNTVFRPCGVKRFELKVTEPANGNGHKK